MLGVGACDLVPWTRAILEVEWPLVRGLPSALVAIVFCRLCTYRTARMAHAMHLKRHARGVATDSLEMLLQTLGLLGAFAASIRGDSGPQSRCWWPASASSMSVQTVLMRASNPATPWRQGLQGPCALARWSQVGQCNRTVELVGELREVHVHGLGWRLTLNPSGQRLQGRCQRLVYG